MLLWLELFFFKGPKRGRIISHSFLIIFTRNRSLIKSYWSMWFMLTQRNLHIKLLMIYHNYLMKKNCFHFITHNIENLIWILFQNTSTLLNETRVLSFVNQSTKKTDGKEELHSLILNWHFKNCTYIFK